MHTSLPRLTYSSLCSRADVSWRLWCVFRKRPTAEFLMPHE
jgi:hypothetical protein